MSDNYARENAQIVKRSETFGSGMVWQLAGILFIIIGVILWTMIIPPFVFVPIGLILNHIGEKKCRWHECSLCGTKLQSNKVRICHGCQSYLINHK